MLGAAYDVLNEHISEDFQVDVSVVGDNVPSPSVKQKLPDPQLNSLDKRFSELHL